MPIKLPCRLGCKKELAAGSFHRLKESLLLAQIALEDKDTGNFEQADE